MHRDQERRDQVNYLTPVLIVICIIAALALWYVLKMPRTEGQKQIQLKEEQGSAVVIEEPEIKYPVPETSPKPDLQIPVDSVIEQTVEGNGEESFIEPEPPPSIDEQLNALIDNNKFGELILREALINRFVVTIDNMMEAKLPQKFSFTERPPGKFLITKDDNGNKYIDPKNYDRYLKYVEFVQSIDLGKFVQFYVRHYALFQKAYQDLGYPDRYFNDRFVEVIDHLLVTPEIQGQPGLEQPKYFYILADENLEALSAGQKILVRIGPENARTIKARLHELKKVLTSL